MHRVVYPFGLFLHWFMHFSSLHRFHLANLLTWPWLIFIIWSGSRQENWNVFGCFVLLRFPFASFLFPPGKIDRLTDWQYSDTVTPTSCIWLSPGLSVLFSLPPRNPSRFEPSAVSWASFQYLLLSFLWLRPAATAVCMLLNVALTVATTWLCRHLHHEAS